MLKTLEKYFGAISSLLFAVLMVIVLYIEPKWAYDIINSVQRLPKEIQGIVLVLSIVTAWSGIKEFTG